MHYLVNGIYVCEFFVAIKCITRPVVQFSLAKLIFLEAGTAIDFQCYIRIDRTVNAVIYMNSLAIVLSHQWY